MDTSDLSPAERLLWDAFPRGETVVLDRPDDGHAENGRSWGTERTVRARVIRALLLGDRRQEGENPLLRLSGARITGKLDLRYCVVAHPVRLSHCHFDRTPFLYGAEVRQFNLRDSFIPGLDAATLRVNGVLRITGCRIPGPVKLGAAVLSGAFFLDGARLGEEDAPDRAAVLQLNHATITHDVVASGLVAHGEVRLTGATVGGSVQLGGAELHNPGGIALDAESVTIGARLRARGIRTVGKIDICGAQVPGLVDFSFAKLTNPGGTALRASSATLGEILFHETAPIVDEVNLRRAQVGLLDVAPEVWAGTVNIDGLTYTSLTPRLPAKERLPLLARADERYVPHSYEQLAAEYRRLGDEAAARTVHLAKQRRHRSTLAWPARTWGYLQDVTVGYGFRPMRAAAWLVLLLAIGTTVFGPHPPVPVKPGEDPGFNPFFYTLDLLLPVIDLGQERAFKPVAQYQWFAYSLILAGWLLAITVVTGITRTLSRQ